MTKVNGSGKSWANTTAKREGEKDYRLVRSSERTEGAPVNREVSLETTKLSEGRTISLKAYETARITVGLTINGVHLREARLIVTEMLNREVAHAMGQDRKPQSLNFGDLEAPLGAVVSVEYGRTVPLQAKYHSAKVDVGVSMPVREPEDPKQAVKMLEDTYKQVSAQVADQIVAEVAKLRTLKDGADIGF